MSEQSHLERLRRFFGAAPLPEGIETGIGDDAAVLAPAGLALVWTVDAAVEGIHFRRDWMSLEDIGYRSLMAAASDLAAMAAKPRGVLSALVLPDGFQDDELDRLAHGQAEAAAALGTAIVGGNLARGAELSITTTVLGEAAKPMMRSGAEDGDIVAVAGRLGLAAAGLEALRRGVRGEAVDRAVLAYRRPWARLEAGLAAAPYAHAGIDLSDGLVLDVSRLASESRLGIVLRQADVLSAGGDELAQAAGVLSLDPLELALYGGEDYALLMTFPPGSVVSPFVPVGACHSDLGVFLETDDGARRKLTPRGFDHFAP